MLEVETPLLCSDTVSEPSVTSLQVEVEGRFLQTSPEYAMKRLLAAGSGPIYQICRAFRAGEVGSRHNPEFSLLEWYRPGFDHHQLMAELADLITACLNRRDYSKTSYRRLFLDELNIDPFTIDTPTLRAVALDLVEVKFDSDERDVWLDLLLTHRLEPTLASRGICFVYDYPPSQGALARLGEVNGLQVAYRFELYVDGLELANGYYELTDADEQQLRFEHDNIKRRELGLTEIAADQRLLGALREGLPGCSGVALGLDRLLMCQLGESDIRKVLAFDWQRS